MDLPDTNKANSQKYEMSEEAALVNLNLKMAGNLHDVYNILTGDFADLSPADKAAVVRNEFFDDSSNDETMIREVLDNLHRAGNSPDNALQTYIMAEVFAALAENNDPFPLLAPLQRHLGRLTDAEYARPEKLNEAFQEAILETLGIEPPDNQKMAIDVRNPFAAMAKPQNSQDADGNQPPTHANLRRYLGRNGK